MNPERWAEIAKAFAAERGDDEIISARRCTSHPRLTRCDISGDEESQDLLPQKSENPDKIQSTEIPQELGESDPSLIPILKRIIKEKVDVIDVQREKISSLNQELALFKAAKETSNFSTQTSKSSRESRNVLAERNEATSQTEKSADEAWKVEHEKSKPLSEVLVEKMELMEKRMDALVNFIQSQFPKSTYPNLPSDKLTREREGHPHPPGSGSSTFPMKVWNKPPSLQPRASYGSVLRQAYSRSGSNNSKIHTREGYNSTGNTTSGSKSKFHAWPKINEDDRDGGGGDAHPDPDPVVVEQRLQFLESLVAQLKRKFMRVLQLQKRSMGKGAKCKSVD